MTDLEELEERVERIEKSLDMESDWYDENDDWHNDDSDSSSTTRESKDSTEWVEICGIEWHEPSLKIYPDQEVRVIDDGYEEGYAVVITADKTNSNMPWKENESFDVDGEYGWWTQVELVDDDVLDEYLVTPDDSWRETFEDVFNYGGVEVTEIADTPAVIEKHDYLPIGTMNDIHDKGWRVKCVHSPDHASAHPEVREADGMVIRFTKKND